MGSTSWLSVGIAARAVAVVRVARAVFADRPQYPRLSSGEAGMGREVAAQRDRELGRPVVVPELAIRLAAQHRFLGGRGAGVHWVACGWEAGGGGCRPGTARPRA